MRIAFDIAGRPAVFRWNNVTGQTEIEAAGQTHVLQRMANPLTHFSLSPKRVWQHDVLGHKVRVEKLRPLLFAPFRPNTFSVFVDDQLVASQKGL
jgi:hypothetical protein